MNDDVLGLDLVRRRKAPRRGYRNSGSPQVNVRLEPALYGQLAHAADRMALTEPEVLRRGLVLVLTGYPQLSPEDHDWLLRLAAANDLHADPQAALTALLAHLRRRYPAAGRLAPPLHSLG